MSVIGNPITLGGSGTDWDAFMENSIPAGALTLNTSSPLKKFSGCTALTSVNAPNATSIGDSAFSGCTALTSVNAPNATSIGANAFKQCTALKGDLFFKERFSLADSAFREMTASYKYAPFNRTITLPKVYASSSTTGADAFRNSGFDVIDLGPSFTSCPNRVLYNSLPGSPNIYIVLILRSPTVVSSASSNNNSSLWSTHIYVPAAILDSYKTATNWSRYADNFHAIEGSQYEHYYANGIGVFQTITTTLENCSIDNSAADISYGETYSATLTADTGYSLSSVSVVMNSVDITSTAYNSQTGAINIASVNGPIAITATAA